MVTSTVLPKISAILVLVCILLIAACPALAVDASAGAATRKDKIQERIDTRKENVAERMEAKKEKMATREAALKTKLEKFKDKKKAEAADRINTNLNRINQNQTDQMLKYLDKMSAILTKLETSTGSQSAIADSRASIASATAAVKAQAAKDYTISVTSESTVKSDAQKARGQLHTDLKNVRQMVVDAKQSVAKAIKTAKSEGAK